MTLRGLIVTIATLVLLCGALVLSSVFVTDLARYGDETARSAVRTRSVALANAISRSLYDQWLAIEQQAARISPDVGPDSLQVAVDTLAAANPKSSWIGIARANGQVVAASDGYLVGESVSGRPWFGEGLQGPFAGDVHEAVLLARLMKTDNGEPLRFIDFSAPIRNADGSVWGVLGAHVNWRWVRELITSTADSLDLDAFVVNAAGTVILSTAPTTDAFDDLGIFRSAALGRAAATAETWPDGKTYYSVVLEEPALGSLPPLGWNYVVRLDPEIVFGAGDRFTTRMAVSAALTLLAALIVFAVAITLLTRPLQVLLLALQKLSRGESVGYQREGTTYRELTYLSEAIAWLQSRPLTDRPGNDPPQ